MKHRIKIGQIGIGHNHGSEKMATVRRLPEIFEVVGVVEPDPHWRQQRGELPQYKNLPWLTEEQLFNTPGLQVVLVESDVPDLVATAKRCLEAGFHIHMDKPAGYDLLAYADMLDNARRKNLTVQLGYMFRSNPAVKLCLQFVREGWLGNVFEIDTVMSRQMSRDYRNWMSQFKGGSMYIFGSHLIDLIVAMLGKPDRVTTYLQKTHPELDDLEDNCLAVLEYPEATATVRSAVVEVDGFRRRQLVVCGDQGTMEIKPIEGCDVQKLDPPLPVVKPRLTLAKACGPYHAGFQEVCVPAMSGRYTDQLSELASIVRNEIENPFSLEHEMLVQQVLLAACCDEPMILN
ncbi:MAG: dehydrogenase [Phycisphaeraceae bacterium]|nr:dehydrogenase [Phycisphaeraceae bacterium]